jgi:predicted DNA-binding ribbon-helix-helix protein
MQRAYSATEMEQTQWKALKSIANIRNLHAKSLVRRVRE